MTTTRGIFYDALPPRDRCAICATTEGLQLQTRPTGPHLRLQEWAICSGCLLEQERQRENRDPAICFMYAVFVRRLTGGYGF